MVTTPDSPFINIRGTSETHFRIGINGPTIYFGTDDPNVTPPVPIPDGFKNGDLYIQIQTGSETVFIRQSGIFNPISSAGNFFTNDVTFDSGAQLLLDETANATAPALAFDGDVDTGIFRGAPDELSFATSGLDRFSIEANGVMSSNTISYESLVTSDNHIPNRKFVLDNTLSSSGDTIVGDLILSGGDILLDDGTAADPSLAFAITPTTGIFTTGTNDLRITANGSQVAFFSTLGLSFSTGAQLLLDSSSAASPGLAAGTDPGTGIFFDATPNTLAFSTNASERLRIANGSITSTVPVRGPSGSATTPSISFSGDIDSGLFTDGNSVRMSVAGTERVVVEPDGTLSVSTVGYEGLVSSPNDIPNRQYVQNNTANPGSTATISGEWTFTGTPTMQQSLDINIPVAAIDEKLYKLDAGNTQLALSLYSDTGVIGSDIFRATRSGTTLQSINFGTIGLTANGNAIWHAGNDGPGSGLNADLLDNRHAGNAIGDIPINNGTVNANLNADLIDGLNSSQLLRSDITQTFSGTSFIHSSTTPIHTFIETDASVDNGRWRFVANAETFSLQLLNDTDTVISGIFNVIRTGTTVNTIDFPLGILQNQGNNVITTNGGTLTNFLTLHANPTNNFHAATKQYVDAVAGGGGGATGVSVDEFTATGGQTIFNTTNVSTTAKTTTQYFQKVFKNGVLQKEGASFSFTVTGANQITFNTGLVAGDEVIVFQE